MKKEWISLNEASLLTHKSEMTIRRFISKYKNNHNAIKNDDGTIYINTDFLNKVYPITYDSQMLSDDKIIEHKENLAEFTLQKQDKDLFNSSIANYSEIIDKLMQKKPFYSLPSLWISLGFIILFLVAGYLGYLYRNEMISNYQLSLETYQSSLKDKDSSLSDLKAELNNTRTEYKESLNKLDDLRSSYDKKLEARDKEISKLKEQLQDAEEGI